MNYTYDLKELDQKNYPLVIIPEPILNEFDREISYEEILSHLGESYYAISSRVVHDPVYITLSQSKVQDYSLSEYLDLENGDYKFMFSDFYFSNSYSRYKLPRRPSRTKSVTVEEKNGCLLSLIIFVSFIIFFIIKDVTGSIYILSVLITLSIVSYFIGLFDQKVSVDVQIEESEYDKIVKDFKSQVDSVISIATEEHAAYKMEKLKIVDDNRSRVEKEIYDLSLRPQSKSQKINSPHMKGRMELFFLEKLYDYFGERISIDVVPIEQKNAFQPDYLLICEKTDFHLAIEIDEPYSVENGKPIHHDRSNDEKRNIFFEKLNWGIIRFSEKQIVENHEECCSFINDVLQCVRNKQRIFSHKVKPDRKWSYEESLIMSNNNYRNTYLPNNMKIEIRDKSNDIDEEFTLPF